MRECVFCRIIAGAQHGAFVYQDERVAAFLDLNQAAVGHTLVAPRAHVAFWWELTDEDAAAIAVAAKRIAHALRAAFDPPGILLEQRNGRAAGQDVFHAHLHLIPRGGDYGPARADPRTLDQAAARIRERIAHGE